MDIYCPNCGEAWDNDSLHEEAYARAEFQDYSEYPYREVMRDFQRRGCEALATAFGPQTCQASQSDRAVVASAMYDLLGDDMDGAAAMMEDFGF